MASYGGGGPPGPPGLVPPGDGSIQAILARLQQQGSVQQSQMRPAQTDNNDQPRQYAAQQLQQQPQQQQWQHQQPAAPDMRNMQPTFTDNIHQHQHHSTHSQQSAEFNTAARDYPPPAAPNPPPSGLVAPPGMSAKDSSLLQLLKATGGHQDQQSSSSQPSIPSQQPSDLLRRESMIRHASDQGPRVIHAPAPNAADPTGVLAALMMGRYQEDPTRPEPQQAHAQEQQPQPLIQRQHVAPGSNWNPAAPSEATEQLLLNLLNKPKPSQHDEPVEAPANESTEQHVASPSVPTAPSFEFAPKETNPPHIKFHASPAPADSSRDGSPAAHVGMFTHKDPFRELHDVVSSPANRASASPTVRAQANVPVQILKKSDEHKRLSSTSSHLEGRESVRRKYDSTPTSQGHQSNPPYPVRESEHEENETVSQAVSDIEPKLDKEAQEAVARAEDEEAQARIAQELENMMAAETNKEFESAAAIAASDIKLELDKEHNTAALDVLGSDLATAVRDVLDDAAQGPVVDSWESAEAEDEVADEIVIIEETSKPITVWNLPIKPWISINVNKDMVTDLPAFRDESILDIARLKKEFDQMDRNLVAATNYTLAYGMSKAGGLRVIRQDDGRDAKLFSDTKDRIFNVAISSTPADENTTAKEALIGTGISGTVYWIQTKDGEKDHIEDAHIEQYGFACPPSSAQEGEAPGGVLKTRARPSSSHPEYFAVGRGKSINIIFPAFVMQRNLLKPNHDRVVDTDRLARECSLKINTGKAGKDFSFSHDDTMVVSLDKSGRVKFWDVRELTATDENRMPVHKSFEVKEPLMTLTTTPEGEKAWPTSVLLLDKLRPYQKRTALRYMIVGMKQNHTLQLWDLALGKPVQEFNLPHHKESDAVCSIMYHPPSGIIVVGHPTRNSIYFLHLSAPKYALKSSSQVDYINNLMAQDSPITVPDSTAVISGMREYTFANKGILRSLYLLHPPASDCGGEEPTLFELYAMHSRGVACISIKAADLGWDKDNKVTLPVDATAVGIVEIGKLKQPPFAAAPQPVEEAPPTAPIRLAVRSKETTMESPLEQSATRKPREDVSSPKQREPRDEEPAPSTSEKPEKKSRKKKAAAEKAAAAAAALAEREAGGNQTNGAHPRVVHTTTRKSPEPSKPSPSFTQEIDVRINSLEKRLAESIIGELTSLRQTLTRDAEDRDIKFADKQGDILASVSDCLNENCEKVLEKIIHDELEQTVTPMVGRVLERSVVASFDSKLSTTLIQCLQKTLQKEMRKELQAALPTAMDQALRKPELVKSITEKMVGPLANKIDEQLYAILDEKIIPHFTKVATDAALSCGNEILANVSRQFGTLEQIREQENRKFDQLLSMNASMSETMNKMAIAQAGFQDEILRLKSEISQQRQVLVPQNSMQQMSPGGFRGGPVSYHSPSNSQSQSMSHLSAPVSVPQQKRFSPLGSFAANQVNRSSAGAPSPPQAQQQQWANGPSALVSPPYQQYPGSKASFQGANPTLAALQQSQQFGSPSSQVSSQVASLRSRETAHDQLVHLDAQCQRVRSLMDIGNYDGAIMAWVQDSKGDDEDRIFAQVLSKYDPGFLQNFNPLMLLTAATTVTLGLDTTQVLPIRLAWAETILGELAEVLPRARGQVKEVAPRVTSLIKERLEKIFIKLSKDRPLDPLIAHVKRMIEKTREITDSLAGPEASFPAYQELAGATITGSSANPMVPSPAYQDRHLGGYGR